MITIISPIIIRNFPAKEKVCIRQDCNVFEGWGQGGGEGGAEN